jgi:hypothetical protein
MLNGLALPALLDSLRKAGFVAVCAVLFAAAFLAVVNDAHAVTRGVAATAGTSCPAGESQTIGGGIVANCDCYDGVANRIVGCVRQTIDNAAERFFNPRTGFFSIVKQAVFALITFSVVIYGVMVASGMVEKLGRDTLVLLLKVGFVVWGVENTDWIYQQMMAMVDALSAAMFNFNTLDAVPDNACPNKPSVWMRIDCVLDTIIGIDMSERLSEARPGLNSENWANDLGSASGLERGLVGVFFTIMKGSDIGFITGVIGLIATWTMVVFLVKVLFSFLAAFIGLAFMVMLGPLFIPLVIFKSTKQYFDKWYQFIITTALQPVLMLTFVTFATAAMDLVIFSGERSIYQTIAGNEAKQPGFNMNSYLIGEIPDPDHPGQTKIDESRGFLVDEGSFGIEQKGESSALDYNQITGKIRRLYGGRIRLFKPKCRHACASCRWHNKSCSRKRCQPAWQYWWNPDRASGM